MGRGRAWSDGKRKCTFSLLSGSSFQAPLTNPMEFGEKQHARTVMSDDITKAALDYRCDIFVWARPNAPDTCMVCVIDLANK